MPKRDRDDEVTSSGSKLRGVKVKSEEGRASAATQDPIVEAALSARAKICATTIAKLVKRTKRLGSTTRDVENYARFMSLKVAVQDWYAAELSPAPEVDKIWHAHLLDTRDYLETCQAMGVPQLCSGLIHHNPDGGDDVEARAKRRARAHQLYVKVFGEELQEAEEEEDSSSCLGEEDLDVDGMSEESLTSLEDEDEESSEDDSSVHQDEDDDGVNSESLAPANDQISLKVVNGDGGEVFFKIKRSTVLKKLIDAYGRKLGIHPNTVIFHYDGAPLYPDRTPDDLEMDDDDIIDAVVEQWGC